MRGDARFKAQSLQTPRYVPDIKCGQRKGEGGDANDNANAMAMHGSTGTSPLMFSQVFRVEVLDGDGCACNCAWHVMLLM
jgi:hypothetical protein